MGAVVSYGISRFDQFLQLIELLVLKISAAEVLSVIDVEAIDTIGWVEDLAEWPPVAPDLYKVAFTLECDLGLHFALLRFRRRGGRRSQRSLRSATKTLDPILLESQTVSRFVLAGPGDSRGRATDGRLRAGAEAPRATAPLLQRTLSEDLGPSVRGGDDLPL
jgi:hypothetical protein